MNIIIATNVESTQAINALVNAVEQATKEDQQNPLEGLMEMLAGMQADSMNGIDEEDCEGCTDYEECDIREDAAPKPTGEAATKVLWSPSDERRLLEILEYNRLRIDEETKYTLECTKMQPITPSAMIELEAQASKLNSKVVDLGNGKIRIVKNDAATIAL